MAQRSSGLFPREGFNLDAELEITDSPVAAKVTLAHAKTIRIIVLGLDADADDGVCTVTIGGKTVAIDQATDVKDNVGIAHIRGALCDDPANTVEYALTGVGASVGGVFYELLDGPQR